MSASAPKTISLQMKEMLFSKMTHDLVSPAGATENGLELLEEESGDMAAEALQLVKQSAAQVSARMRVYRLCFGTAGAAAGMDLRTIQQTLSAFYRFEEKYTLTFENCTGDLSAEAKKLLFNIVMCAADALMYGGDIHVSWAAGVITITATSKRPEKPVKADALIVYTPTTQEPETLTPYNVQAWYTGYYAQLQGIALTVSLDNPAVMVVVAKSPNLA
jgi:histidine phosphotransferase ChpT